MLSKFVQIIKNLVPLRNFFFVVTLLCLMLTIYFLFSGNPNNDKYLLPGFLLTVWCFCIGTVAWSYQFLELVTPGSGFFNKFKYKIMKLILRVSELLFLMMTISLLILSFRAFSWFLKQ